MTGDNMRQVIKNRRGFSLVEMLVSVAVFIVLITVALSIFQSVVRNQRNAIAAQSVQESMRFALEVMSKELRSAKHVYDKASDNNDCDPGSVGSTNHKVYNVYNTALLGDVLYFKNKETLDVCVYYYVKSADGRLYIERNGLELPLTPDELVVSDFEVVIDDNDIGEFHDVQAVVTIKMHAEIDSVVDKHAMDLQTTISSRYYE